MNGSEIEQYRTALEMYYNNYDNLFKLYQSGRLKLCKPATFVLSHIFAKSVDNIDLELMNNSVRMAVEIYKREEYLRTVITGDFYNELRLRYFRMLNTTAQNDPDDKTSAKHIAWMIVELGSTEMSETKKHRWLGYIQGCLVMNDLIYVDDERELTRSMFNGK